MNKREMLFKDLEEMETNCDFADHFNKMVEIVKTADETDRILLLYKLLLNVRELGYNEGKKTEVSELQQYLNKRQP